MEASLEDRQRVGLGLEEEAEERAETKKLQQRSTGSGGYSRKCKRSPRIYQWEGTWGVWPDGTPSPAYALHRAITVRFKVSTVPVGAGLERQGGVKDNFIL